LLVLVALVFYSAPIFAQHPIVGDLAACERVCSAYCRSLASDVGIALQSYNRTCGGTGGCGDMTDTYAACDNAMDGDTNENECIRHARSGCLGPDVINSCEAAFDGDANELSCVAYAASGPINAAAVNACEVAMDGDTNELRCIEIAGRRRLSAGDVNYCEANRDGDENELSCMEGL
jgi:hypothetical protein